MLSHFNGCTSACESFTAKRGNAVLSFPVCNCLKSCAGIRTPHRPVVLHGAAAEGLDSGKCPLAGLWLCGIYFLSRNMTSAGSVWAPSTLLHSWAAAVPPAHPLEEGKVEGKSHKVSPPRAGHKKGVTGVRICL